MEKEIICTVCPTGCIMHVVGTEKEIESIEGYTCPRGKKYGEAEFLAPVRILTSTVKSNEGRLIPCRSKEPLPKDKVLECMEVLRGITVVLPIKRGDSIVADILGTGIDIVATGE